jgi:hypothetical protein
LISAAAGSPSSELSRSRGSRDHPPSTTSQPRKGDVTGCQFGALGACPVVPGGCPHPTGWWGHPNHCQLPREALGTRDPTTARHIRCLRGMRKARGGSPLRHHFAPAPRVTTHWVRLVRRAVLRAAPRAPGLASRALIYSDPDLTRQRGVDELLRASRLHDGAAA